MADKSEVKALLARAGVEINNALHRVDHMSAAELTDVAHSVGNMKAFFDKNGSCGRASPADLAAFFDKNGSCGGRAAGLDVAFKNVLGR
jgi:hypothetical protein